MSGMRITNIQYHRNGSGCCDGFTQVFFEQDRVIHKNLMAIAFESSGQFAVIDLEDPTAKFDGDYHRPKIEKAIATWESSWDASQAKYTIKFPFTVK